MADPESGGLLAQRPQKPRSIFFFLCLVLNIATGICSSLCLVAHGMAFFASEALVEDFETMRQQSLRMFGIMFAVVILLVETEWESCARQLRLLEGWTARGIFYVFFGLLTLQIARSAGTDDYDRSVNLYSNFAGASLLVCGGVYFIGGVLCLGKIKKALRRKVGERTAEKERIEKDLRSLKSKQEELQDRLAIFSDE